MPKHNWEDVPQGIEGLSNYGKRRCVRCGAVQTKESQQVWMRIVGYRWVPLAGRCVVSKHGGKRAGAGRKPRPDGKGRTVPKSIKVSQEVADYLSHSGTGIIETMIRKSQPFKAWAKSLAK